VSNADGAVGTEEVKSYHFNHGSIKFTLVDTPGFDDSRSSDQIIIGKILAWLHRSYCEDTQLNGLIFIHRISDPKMGGTALSNLRMFRQLCGPDCLKNVVLGTTFWGSVDMATGERREKELVENDQFWGRMVAKGSQVVRLKEDRPSNLKVLLKVAKNNRKIVVEAQKEMLAGKSAPETSAAREANREWKQWKLEKEQELAAENRKLQAEFEEKKRVQRALLQQKKKEAEKKIREAQEREAEVEREREHDRVRRQVELKAQQQREREQQAARERRAQKALREEQADQKRRLQDIKRQHYKNYECCRMPFKRGWCGRCRSRIHTDTNYYRNQYTTTLLVDFADQDLIDCCFCYNDNYDHCYSCGNCCNVTDHPHMKLRSTLKSDCTVM
jgi:hypothetical protein